MSRRHPSFLHALPFLFAAGIAAAASGDGGVASGEGRSIYIVTLDDAPLAAFAGSPKARRADGSPLPGTANEVTGARKLDVRSKASRDYLGYLDARHVEFLARAGGQAKRVLTPIHRYQVVANGLALELSADEARALRALPGVRAVEPDRMQRLLTDAGPGWIGADRAWTGTIPGSTVQTRGEGAVVAVIDSGINAGHPSFADVGGDGYNHSNPRGQVYGVCLTTPGRCNDKLIGIYDFTSEGARDGADLDGHGSHVASTAAGNVVPATVSGTGVTIHVTLSGVAPHANIISYKGCIQGTAGSEPGCPFSFTLAATDRAVADQVDVINFSIGGGAGDPWQGVRDGGGVDGEEAFLNARAAGVLTAISAGNDGPGAATVSSPANAPWVVAVAAATSNRVFGTRLTNVTGTGISTPREYVGAALTGSLPTRTIVQAKDYNNNALCNGFAPGTFSGQIVICERGVLARVQKSANVATAGGGGMILVNTAAEGESVVSDAHSIPSVHLGKAAGDDLKAVVEAARLAGGQVTGSISAAQRELGNPFGDQLASFSSRGPVVPYGNWLKPNITAPGSNILAAGPTGSSIITLSGTSMSSPHVAGAAALVAAARPTWNVAQIESALLTTGLTGVTREDGVTAADAHDAGIGRAYVPDAIKAALHLPTVRADFVAADPGIGGSPKALNMPYLVDQSCFERCTFTRTVTDNGAGGSWRAELRNAGAVAATFNPPTFTLPPGGSQAISIELDVRDASLVGRWVYGEVALVNTSTANVPDARLPIAVFADPGALPEVINLSPASTHGFQDVALQDLIALPDAGFAPAALARMQRLSQTVTQDPTRNDPYDNPANGGVLGQVTVTGGASAERRVLLVDVNSPTATDVDLFVGLDAGTTGSVNEEEEVCRSTSSIAVERCLVTVDLAAGESKTYWVFAQNWDDGQIGGDLIRLDFGISGAPTASGALSAGSLTAGGPGKTTSRQPFALRVSWSEPRLQADEKWLGAIGFDADTEVAGSFAVVPVLLTTGGSVAQSPVVLDPTDTTLALRLAPGAAHERIVVDVPPGATSLLVDTGNGLPATGDIDLYVAKASGALTPPDVPAAPPRGQAQGTSIHPGSLESVDIQGAALTPGRWYLTPVNAGTTTTDFTLRVRTTTAGAAATLRNNGYFNPARSGHGVFFSEGSGQWVMFWYTYLQDGSPIWYVAQTTAPAADDSVWTAPLYRFTWDGGASNGVVAGEVIVTRTAADQFNFSWRVDGTFGTEAMVSVANPACVNFGGSTLDYGGSWYAPALSGYGYSVLTFPSTEVEVAYLYDALGQPRWLYGQNSPFGSGSFALTQYRGFCPTCAFSAIQGSAGGTLARTFGSGRTGTANLNATFVAPVSGTWSTNQPTEKLTRDIPCQ
jgi:subtilisin family serine protease